MSWDKTIKRILGYFWLNVWQDSWLIQVLCKFFNLVVGNTINSRLQQIAQQTSYKAQLKPDFTVPVKILVDAKYDEAVIPISQLFISSTEGSYIGQTTGDFSYKSVTKAQYPEKILNKVSEPSVILVLNQDYKLDHDNIIFSKPLTELGFSTQLVTVNGELMNCFQLWGTKDTYNTIKDSFTGIMGLPDRWLYQYPGAVEAAWSIKQNGSNKQDVFRLIGSIGQCPVALEDGMVKLINQHQLKINDKVYKSPGIRLVGDGQFVQKDTPLFASTNSPYDTVRIYSGDSELPSIIRYIHVLTEVGVLKALNTSQPSVDGVLPLTGEHYIAYKDLCSARSQDEKIPYAQVPNPVNPAAFVFNNIWGGSALLIMTPSANQEDMRLAADFIARNTVKGAISLIYRFDPKAPTSPELLYPNDKVQEQIMVYYNTSVNNGNKYKERSGDFEQ